MKTVLEETAEETPIASCRLPVQRNSRRRRAGHLFLACSLAAALASCSADQVNSPKSATPSPAGGSIDSTPSAAAGIEALQDPLEDKPFATAPGTTVISEKGTGSGTYAVEGGLASGQTVAVTVSCRPGSRAAVTAKTTPLVDSNFPCGNKSVGSYTSAPSTQDLPEFAITVTTDEEAPYWLAVRIADAG